MNLTPPLDPALLEQSFTLFRLSRMLYAIAALNLPACLAAGPQDADTLASRTCTHAPTLASLLDTLVCWGVFSRDDQGRYGLTAVSKRLLPGGEDPANVPLLLGWAGFPGVYDAFGDLLYTLRTGESAFHARHGTGFHGYLTRHPDLRELYDRAMESTADGFRNSSAAYDFSGARHIVDIGGGKGALALEILSRFPNLRATVLDLPEVVERAWPDGHPAADRLTLIGGDAFTAIPEGGDIYVTSTVLRCFNDVECLRLLANIRAAMSANKTVSGARLAAFEMILPDGRDHLGHCTADLVARVVYGGRDRTEQEFRALFAQAGLRHTRTLPVEGGGGVSVLEAVPA